MSRLKRLTGHLALLLALSLGGWAVTSQVAPASAAAPLPPELYILTSDTTIAIASANSPGSPSTPLAVEGLTAGDALAAIDVRPQNGRLYGLGYNSGAGTAQLYHLSVNAAKITATPVGTTGAFVAADGTTPVPITGTAINIDFNPTVDRLRVVTNTGQNFRINPNTGAFVDGDTGGAAGSVTGLNQDAALSAGSDATAYTNSFVNAAATTQYTLDSGTNQLYIQNPPNAGTLTNGTPLTLNGSALDFTAASLDIPPDVIVATSNIPATGSAYAMLTVAGNTGLYQVNTGTGATALLGSFGELDVRDTALVESIPAAIALSADGTSLQRFRLDTPGTVVSVTITGIVAGETLVGIDGRPATGQLFGLGVDAAADTATLYLIDPQTGAATIVGTASQIAFVDGGGNPIDLPDATGGYGFDFNPTVDRIRVVAETGLNFRLNPVTGAAVDGDAGATGVNPDGAINGASTTVSAAGYTNGLAGETVTTLYTLDAVSNLLLIQNPPNAGVQTAPVTITLDTAPLDFTSVNGFDIPPSVRVATTNAPANDEGYAALTVGGDTGLYAINLTTGVARFVGGVGEGTAEVGGLVVWGVPEPVYSLALPLVVQPLASIAE
jgi:hypothetical protein